MEPLGEALASDLQMFSHSIISQEFQVVMKHILIDSVLSLRHFVFKPQNKAAEHVSVAEENLEQEPVDPKNIYIFLN